MQSNQGNIGTNSLVTDAVEDQNVPGVGDASGRPEGDARAASPSDESSNAVSDRRKQGERRDNKSRNESLSRTPHKFRNYTVPSDWWWMALSLALILPVGAIMTQALPPIEILIVGAVGALIAFGERCLSRLERIGQETNPFLVMSGWMVILIPAACFGFNVAYWGVHGGLNWPYALAILVSGNAFSASLLSGRVRQQFACQLAIWAPVSFVLNEGDGYIAFGMMVVMVLLVGHHQSKLAVERARRGQERERERNRAEQILREYEETGQGWFWETDRRGSITYVSPGIPKVLRTRSDQLLGRPLTKLFDFSDASGEGERSLKFHLSARSAFQELGVRAATEGEERWWSVSGRPAYDDFQNFVGFRGSGTDLTEKKRSQENATRLARYDSLTGLANRFQMLQTLEKILTAPKIQQRNCSVFLLDLDRFKHVNDTLGHPAGDALLKQVSQRLEYTVGKIGQVGRLGGDEFKVIFPGEVSREDLMNLARDIINSLSQPYSLDGQRVVIGASIGIAVAPEDGDNAEAIIRNSDLALYAAKDGGRGRFHFYSEEMHSAAEERNEMEQDLRDAITEGNLKLYFQPVISVANGEVSGFEALLRWEHPTKGWISPAKFIPIAEDTGLISTIGEWAIRSTCAELAKWPESVRCAVNVSPLQFASPQLPAIITNAIANAGITATRLELEITESVFLNDDEGTDAMFAALKQIGVRLALDDFGTGYSSLGYLKKAPFDKIKIDQSFVRGATQPGSNNGAIIQSITSLAKALGMDTTAEGVETKDELQLVHNLGCSHIQGFIYSPAINAEDAELLVQKHAILKAEGPSSARSPRQTVLRKVMMSHGGHEYEVTIRNLSTSGALIEGLGHAAVDSLFSIALGPSLRVSARVMWSSNGRTGVKFAHLIDLDEAISASHLAPKRQPIFLKNEDQKRMAG